MAVSWVVVPCSLVEGDHRPDDGGSSHSEKAIISTRLRGNGLQESHLYSHCYEDLKFHRMEDVGHKLHTSRVSEELYYRKIVCCGTVCQQ
jgi:hypothetical protein